MVDTDGKTLVPVEQQEVDFYDDRITAVRMKTGHVYVPIRPICGYLGIDWSGQRQRILRDPVLSDEMRIVVITPTNLGGDPERLALPLKFIPGWLFGINSSRVKEALCPACFKQDSIGLFSWLGLLPE